jgi:ribonucleotide reductase beta subunit family protein with ferritin-like domain
MKNYLIPVYDDPQIVDFADKQMSVFWLPDEIKVEKDIQDILVNFTEAERHSVIETLRLFSIYETHIGDEWWGGRFKDMFQRADYHRMASVFSMVELAIHSVFYNKINELLYINTPEFFLSYQDDEDLKSRMNFIDSMVNNDDDAIALAAFCFCEGVILYSNFAFLIHFQSQGKNKLANIVRGLQFSVRDENLHAIASAYAFKVRTKDMSVEDKTVLQETIYKISEVVLEHETAIIKKLFAKGKIEGITESQLVNFVKSRIDVCLKEMGMKRLHNVTYNPIQEWFYKGINDFQFNDFFAGTGNQYNRNWGELEFKW